MKIAVIGGGASGLITAYLLDGAHEVTVYEKQEVLGGHIRTLGKNADPGRLEPGVVLDNGVIEFERTSFRTFSRLLSELGVETEEIPSGTGLFLADGRRYLSHGALRRSALSRPERATLYARLLPLAPERRRFLSAVGAVAPAELSRLPLSHFLRPGIFRRWLRMLVMYAYSTPFAETLRYPAAVAVPVLSHILTASRWIRIVGGVYTYVERLLERFGGTVRTGTAIRRVLRDARGAEVELEDGTISHFDAVVFAATPDQTLALLSDPSEAEKRRFGAWSTHRARTCIHRDASIYAPWRAGIFTEFDLFELAGGRDAGYNAYLNRLCGLATEPPIFMAYNLEALIDPSLVLQIEEHVTPRYSVEAVRYRHEAIATNGERNTYHAGAWLGDGLHEGATVSAVRVAELLSGRRLQ